MKRSVVVTGGGSGIGRAIAESFSTDDYQVFVLDSSESSISDLPANITGLVCDMGASDDVERACQWISSFGPVIVLVNNVGVGGSWKRLAETSVEEWDRVLNVNLRSHWLMAKYLVDHMPQGASIVNIASTRAVMSEANTELYSASKGGVVALTHSLAMSLADREVRVNCISPGWINTHDEALSETDHSQHPSGRVGTAADVAALCRFLSSEQASFITGANYVIDGGMTRKMIYI